MQDESSIAAHLGERAPKLADDESAALDQQDNTEDVDDQEPSLNGSQGTLVPLMLPVKNQEKKTERRQKSRRSKNMFPMPA